MSEFSLFLAVKDYLKAYAMGGKHTAKAKRVDLEYLVNFFKKFHPDIAPEQLTVSLISHSSLEQFVDSRLKEGESPATVIRRVATIKHFCRYLVDQGKGLTFNPAKGIRAPSVQVERPKALSNEIIDEIVEHLRSQSDRDPSYRNLRDQLLILMLLHTGLRADEIRILRLGQLSKEHDWLSDVRTKGRKFRKVYLPKTLSALIDRYLGSRELELKRKFANISPTLDERLPLFISLRGSSLRDLTSFRLNEKTIWRIVHNAGASFGVHPHLMRHTFALRLLDTTNDIRLVAQALGHSDVRVTMKYTERSDEDVARAMEDLTSIQKVNSSKNDVT